MASFEEAPSSMHSTARAESADSADLAPLEVSLAQASLAAAAVAEVTAAAVAETAVALVAVAATVAAVAAAAESLDAADEADDAESDDDASESDDEQSDDESPEAAYVAAASRDETGLTALHWAGIDGNSEAATALLAAGCQVDATDEGGWTALHETAKAGHADVVALLLAAGADAAATSLDGHTARNPRRGNTDRGCKEWLSDAQKIPELVAFDDVGAGYDGAEAEKVRAYVDKRDGTAVGATALHHAAFCGHLSVVQLLVARGADVEKAAASRATVLHFASQQPDGRIAQFLERRGAQKLAPFQSWARAYVELLGDAAEYTEVEPDVTRMDDVCEDVCEDDARGDDGDGRPPRFTSHRVLAYDSRGTRILVDALCFAAPEALNAQLAAAAEALQREPSARASNHGAAPRRR